MSRYIDADKLKEECYKFANDVSRNAMAFVQGQINAVPTADVVEVRHGEWIEEQRPYSTSAGVRSSSLWRKCSVCDGAYPVVTVGQHLKKYKHCFECGAKMDGERSENGT